MMLDPVPVFVHQLERGPDRLPQRPFVADDVDPVRPEHGGRVGGKEIFLDRGGRLRPAGLADQSLHDIKAFRKILRELDFFPGSGGEIDLPVDAGDAVAAPVEQSAADRHRARLPEAEIGERHSERLGRRLEIRVVWAVEAERDPALGRKLRGHGEIVNEQPAGLGRGGAGIDSEVDAERIVRREGERPRRAGPVWRRRRQREAHLAPALPVDADGILQLALGPRQEEVPLPVLQPLGDADPIPDHRIEEHARSVAVDPDGKIDWHAEQRGIDGDEPPGEIGLIPFDIERTLAAMGLRGAGTGRTRADCRGTFDVAALEPEVAAIRLEVGDHHPAVGAGEHHFADGGHRAVVLVERRDLQRVRRELFLGRGGEAGERQRHRLRLADRQVERGLAAPNFLATTIEQGPLHLRLAGRMERGILDGGRGIGLRLPLVRRNVIGDVNSKRIGERLLCEDVDGADLD